MYAGDDPVAYVVSLNLRRRHFDESQRAWVAAKLANLPHGTNQWSGKFAGPTQEHAARLLNVSERSVRNAVRVRDEGSPELGAAVERGMASVSAAADLATLPKEEQIEIVDAGPVAVREAATGDASSRIANRMFSPATMNGTRRTNT